MKNKINMLDIETIKKGKVRHKIYKKIIQK